MTIKKYLLSFHTIFILSENIRWLEEFLIYYTHIGFDHFYLYDNEGSTGGDGTTTHNKYGIYAPTKSTQEQQDMFARILEKYSSIITYVKWQPRDDNGNITYSQMEGVRHFIHTYGHETEWVALMDLDEFLYSPADMNIRQYLKDLSLTVSNIVISQEKFIDRYDIIGTYVTQNFRCVHGITIGFEISPKNILRIDDFISSNNIHYFKVKYNTVYLEKQILRFNHYNGNAKQLKELSALLQIDLTLNSTDNGMARYAHLFGLPTQLQSVSIQKRKVLYLGNPNNSTGECMKKIDNLLKETYNIVYYNIYHFYMNSFNNDLNEADLCILTLEAYPVMDWPFFPKSETLLKKIIVLFDSEPTIDILNNLKPHVNYAVTNSSLQQDISTKTHFLPIGFDISSCIHTPKSGELNVIGWHSEDLKDWVYMIGYNAHLPISMAPSTLPFERMKQWYKTIDIFIHTGDDNMRTVYEAIASGVPVITPRNNSSIPRPRFTTQDEAVAILNEFRHKPLMLKALADSQYEYIQKNIAYTGIKSQWSNVFEDLIKR